MPLPQTPGVIVTGAGGHNVTVTTGSIVHLYCPATGIPPAVITIQRRVRGILMPMSKAHVTVVSGVPAIQFSISSFQSSDMGEYVCIAENAAGNESRFIFWIYQVRSAQ